MKKMIVSLVLAGLALAQNPHMKSASAGKVEQTLIFDGKTYVLKFVDQNRIVDLNDYYLRNETPDNWTRMVSVAVYKTTGTPGAMARNMETSLLKAHPDAPHQLITTRDDSQALFQCVNWAGDRATGSELAVFRFQKSPAGVLGYQASLRPYQAKVSASEVKAIQDRWAESIKISRFPGVVLQMP